MRLQKLPTQQGKKSQLHLVQWPAGQCAWCTALLSVCLTLKRDTRVLSPGMPVLPFLPSMCVWQNGGLTLLVPSQTGQPQPVASGEW